MSSPGSSVTKERRHASIADKPRSSRRRVVLRRVILVLFLLGALVLWQLSFVIKELGIIQRELETWKTTRAILGAFLTYAAHEIVHAAHSIWLSVFH